jgi:hypothetical protein
MNSKENNNINNDDKVHIGSCPNISSKKIVNKDNIIRIKPSSPTNSSKQNSRVNSAKSSKPNSPNPNNNNKVHGTSFKVPKKVENDDNKLFKKLELTNNNNNNNKIARNNNKNINKSLTNNNKLGKSVIPIPIKSEPKKPEPPLTTKPPPRVSNRTSFSSKSRKIKENVVIIEKPVFLTEINEKEEERLRIEQEERELRLQQEKLEFELLEKIKLEKELKEANELRLKQESAVIIIQRNYWKLIESREYLLQVEEHRLLLIIRIQRYVRDIFLPYQKFIKNIIRLQSLLRGWIACRRIKKILYNNLLLKSSTTIQSYVRGWLCCKNLKQKWMDNIRHKIQMKFKFENDLIRVEKKKLRLQQEKRMKSMSEVRQLKRPLLSEDIQKCQDNLEKFMTEYKKPHKPTNPISSRLYQPKINKIAALDEDIKNCEGRIEKVLTEIKPNKIYGVQKISPRLYQSPIPKQKKIEEEIITPVKKLTKEEKKLKRKNIMIKKELKKLSKEFSRSKFNLLPVINNNNDDDGYDNSNCKENNKINIIKNQIEKALKCTNNVLDDASKPVSRIGLGLDNIDTQNYNINTLLCINNNVVDNSLKVPDFEQNIANNILEALNKVNKCIELSDYDSKINIVVDNPKKIDSILARSNDIEFAQLYRQNRRQNDDLIEHSMEI